MKFNRSAGILLHPTSLQGPDGIGDLGPAAFEWVSTLEKMGCGLWQILPLGPTGYGDSPYQCFSAFAGNPFMISPAMLINMGLLSQKDIQDRPNFPVEKIDFARAITWKKIILERAFKNFLDSNDEELKKRFAAFQEDEAYWLNNFSIFMSIKEDQKNLPWDQWPKGLRSRLKRSLTAFVKNNEKKIQQHKFAQFIFFDQWHALRNFANSKNIKIIGDIPIFIAYDSADTWANPDLFSLDKEGNPIVVAGVPPDYFSPTGQLWGNPLYRWDVHKTKDYSWWIDRFKAIGKMVDIIRLDHFRGFAGYWEVPAELPTAEVGQWVDGPGIHFFETIQKKLGDLPIIAEDLGEITPDVIELRDHFNFPGMRIAQFGFSGPDNSFLPHNYVPNCVAYTGTHDNDTTLGWYRTAPNHDREYCDWYLRSEEEDVSWNMIKAVWGSCAVMTLAPLQDILNLGGEARMNFPGKPFGNWGWRMPEKFISDEITEKVRWITEQYNRLPKKGTE